MRYEPVRHYSDTEAMRILEYGTDAERVILPISVGEYHTDWKFAQMVCIKLLQSESTEIRANAVLGLSYIARVHRRLDRNLVEPLIRKELETNQECSDRVRYAAEDIYMFLKWKQATTKSDS